jgi:hypothetical protein
MGEPNSICYAYGYYTRTESRFTSFADDPFLFRNLQQSQQVSRAPPAETATAAKLQAKAADERILLCRLRPFCNYNCGIFIEIRRGALDVETQGRGRAIVGTGITSRSAPVP